MLKPAQTTGLVGLALSLLAVPGSQAADLGLTVTNISEPYGTLNWVLFDSAETYAANTDAVARGRHRVTSDTIALTMHNLPSGTYAVRLFHDTNGNGELDTNFLGLPREGYGFSNGAGARGPASFEDAAVQVEGDTTIEVRVR